MSPLARFWAVFVARNKEFYRDRATLGWNLVFPLFILFGMALIFSDSRQSVFEVAVYPDPESSSSGSASGEDSFFALEHLSFVAAGGSLEHALLKLQQHRVDLLVDPEGKRYWVNERSPQGALVERLLLGAGDGGGYSREPVSGRQLRYIDWLLPGLLSMNMMFSCLVGVGYVIVRYRKNGVLRRLKATPLSAVEFLTAQVASRLVLILAMTTLVYVGSDLLLDFIMEGSYLLLAAVFALGGFCLITLGLLLAARTASEELAGGLLNVATFPMIGLSGVWFTIEGAPRWVHWLAQALPLTHVNDAARAVMNDGAGVLQIAPHLLALAVMSLVFLVLGALLFRWE